jgi:hypothetical protein
MTVHWRPSLLLTVLAASCLPWGSPGFAPRPAPPRRPVVAAMVFAPMLRGIAHQYPVDVAARERSRLRLGPFDLAREANGIDWIVRPHARDAGDPPPWLPGDALLTTPFRDGWLALRQTGRERVLELVRQDDRAEVVRIPADAGSFSHLTAGPVGAGVIVSGEGPIHWFRAGGSERLIDATEGNMILTPVLGQDDAGRPVVGLLRGRGGPRSGIALVAWRGGWVERIVGPSREPLARHACSPDLANPPLDSAVGKRFRCRTREVDQVPLAVGAHQGGPAVLYRETVREGETLCTYTHQMCPPGGPGDCGQTSCEAPPTVLDELRLGLADGDGIAVVPLGVTLAGRSLASASFFAGDQIDVLLDAPEGLLLVRLDGSAGARGTTTHEMAELAHPALHLPPGGTALTPAMLEAGGWLAIDPRTGSVAPRAATVAGHEWWLRPPWAPAIPADRTAAVSAKVDWSAQRPAIGARLRIDRFRCRFDATLGPDGGEVSIGSNGAAYVRRALPAGGAQTGVFTLSVERRGSSVRATVDLGGHSLGELELDAAGCPKSSPDPGDVVWASFGPAVACAEAACPRWQAIDLGPVAPPSPPQSPPSLQVPERRLVPPQSPPSLQVPERRLVPPECPCGHCYPSDCAPGSVSPDPGGSPSNW